MKSKTFLITLVITAVVFGAGVYLISVTREKKVACTAEAKICPDGSTVGRTGPKCEFAACPAPSGNFTTTTVKVGETLFAEGLSITPLAVIQDSRCPVDVQCIWAGTVQVSTRISDEIESTEMVLELGKPQLFGDIRITLVSVLPESRSGISILSETYQFGFSVISDANQTER